MAGLLNMHRCVPSALALGGHVTESWPSRSIEMASGAFWERQWCHTFPSVLNMGGMSGAVAAVLPPRKGHEDHRDQALTDRTKLLMQWEKPEFSLCVKHKGRLHSPVNWDFGSSHSDVLLTDSRL